MSDKPQSFWTREWIPGVSVRRCLRGCCSWRMLRRTVLAVACVATFIALFYAVESWRGHQAWAAFQRAGMAEGERYQIADMAPAPVSDEQNMAMAPIFAESFDRFWNPEPRETELRDTNTRDRLQISVYGTRTGGSAPSVGGWVMAEPIDLHAWQTYYRTQHLARVPTAPEFPIAAEPGDPAQDVLLALSRHDDVIAELHQASERPHARFPINYQDGYGALLPHLAKLNGISQVLALRATAQLGQGNPVAALDDMRLGFRLIESIRAEPILISHLVRFVMFEFNLQPVWEGLAHRQWSDADLASIERELEPLDFLSDYAQFMRGERAFGVWTIDHLRRTRNLQELELFGPSTELDWWWKQWFQHARFRAYPGGWFHQSQITLCQFYDQSILPAVDLEQRLVSPEATREAETTYYTTMSRGPYRSPIFILKDILLPTIHGLTDKVARHQFHLDAARIACALERYRRAHGLFPAALDALNPTFLSTLPHDVVTGQPLRYRLTDDGQYVLYSIGWNLTDNGGTIGRTPRGHVDRRQGDWIWHSAPQSRTL
jgi:hypothetical protein